MNDQGNNSLILSGGHEDLNAIIKIVSDGLTSEHSRRAYSKALSDFLEWYKLEGKPGFNKATVNKYKLALQEEGLSPSTINQRMSAIRRLAQEAVDNGLVDQVLANGISNVKGVKSQGVRTGKWLTKEQAQELITLPSETALKGSRDRAILAVMVGAGLRRSEVITLRFEQIQMRENRWVIVDIKGKGNKIRSIPIPAWTKTAIDEWAGKANISTGNVFRPVNRGGNAHGDSITPQAVRDVVNHYGNLMGIELAAHDLRRTYAKLAYRGGSGLDQIQLSLGHSSIQTTERYLGVAQDLTDAPCDHLGIKIDN